MPKAAKKHPVAATKGWAMRMMMAEARADWTSSPLAEATETETAEEVKVKVCLRGMPRSLSSSAPSTSLAPTLGLRWRSTIRTTATRLARTRHDCGAQEPPPLSRPLCSGLTPQHPGVPRRRCAEGGGRRLPQPSGATRELCVGRTLRILWRRLAGLRKKSGKWLG